MAYQQQGVRWRGRLWIQGVPSQSNERGIGLRAMNAEPATPEKPDHRRYTSMTTEGEAAVGRIAIWAAYVEQHLVDRCAGLINGSNFEVGYAVTANMSASSMIQLARKLLSESETVNPANKARTLAALTEAKAVS